ncbi:MAG: DUF2878 domain-containing protein [Rudaea sp.]
MSVRTIWVNAIVFQLAWLLTVAAAGRGLGWVGPLVTVAFAAYTLACGGNARADRLLVCVAATLGFALDSLWACSHVIEYAATFPAVKIAPLWIVALWVNFALSLNHSLAWLLQRPLLAVLFGAVGGPLSYFIADRSWHAVALGAPLASTLSLLALAWAIVTPLLCILARRLRATASPAFSPVLPVGVPR